MFENLRIDFFVTTCNAIGKCEKNGTMRFSPSVCRGSAWKLGGTYVEVKLLVRTRTHNSKKERRMFSSGVRNKGASSISLRDSRLPSLFHRFENEVNKEFKIYPLRDTFSNKDAE